MDEVTDTPAHTPHSAPPIVVTDASHVPATRDALEHSLSTSSTIMTDNSSSRPASDVFTGAQGHMHTSHHAHTSIVDADVSLQLPATLTKISTSSLPADHSVVFEPPTEM